MFKSKFFIALLLGALAVGVGVAGYSMGFDPTLGVLHMGALAVLVAFAPSGAALPGMTCDDPIAQLAQEFKSATEEASKKTTELAKVTDEMKARLERQEELDSEFKKSLDEQISLTRESQSKVNELAQKLEGIQIGLKASKPEDADEMRKSLEESAEFKSFAAGDTGKHRMEFKAVTQVTAAGIMPQPYRDSLVSMERDRLTMRDLLTIIPVTSNAVEYAQQNLRTNNAAPVAEGAQKPYSDYGWETKTAVIRTLAHLAKTSKQAVEDIPRLLAEIQSEMRYGLGVVEEQQLLFGNGTGQNLNGIMPQAITFNQAAVLAKVANPTSIDVLRLAILQVTLANAPVDGIVLNPVDWTLIELEKTTDNAYLFAQLQGTVGKRLWGTRVVETPAMTADNFLVGGFGYGAHMYQRTGVQVDLSTENADDFEKNMMTMRVEERIGLGVRRPYAFSKGVFSTINPPTP